MRYSTRDDKVLQYKLTHYRLRPGKTKQTWYYKTRQHNIIHDKTIQISTIQHKPKQYSIRQNNTIQYKTRQDKTRHANTRQANPEQYKTRQTNAIKDNIMHNNTI